jgi:polysaccharide biosynthesis/export protein
MAAGSAAASIESTFMMKRTCRLQVSFFLAWCNLETALAVFVAATMGFFVAGCTSAAPEYQQDLLANPSPPPVERIILREGDVVRITFPGAPTLNATQLIRRDGKITLPLLGEITAAGKTTQGLEAELIELYSPQIITKEVTVAVESSAFEVYVTGAVLRPGKVISSRPLTALEALMEAGGRITPRRI